MIGIIAKRYAKALADLSVERKNVDKVRADLASIVETVEANPALQKVFANPSVTGGERTAIVAEIAVRLKLQAETRRFLEYLAGNGRIRFVREIRAAFEALLAERENRAMARLTTASDAKQADLAAVAKSLERLTGKTVEISAAVDPSLIGGATARIGSVIYDGSIRTQLAKMRERLGK